MHFKRTPKKEANDICSCQYIALDANIKSIVCLMKCTRMKKFTCHKRSSQYKQKLSNLSFKDIYHTYHRSGQLLRVEPSQHHPSLLEQRSHIHEQLYQPAVTTESCKNLSVQNSWSLINKNCRKSVFHMPAA